MSLSARLFHMHSNTLTPNLVICNSSSYKEGIQNKVNFASSNRYKGLASINDIPIDSVNSSKMSGVYPKRKYHPRRRMSGTRRGSLWEI